jgi:hypothetical protein
LNEILRTLVRHPSLVDFIFIVPHSSTHLYIKRGQR